MQPMKKYLPIVWSSHFEIEYEEVWNVFFLNALLINNIEQWQSGQEQLPLQLPHNVSFQFECLQKALQD